MCDSLLLCSCSICVMSGVPFGASLLLSDNPSNVIIGGIFDVIYRIGCIFIIPVLVVVGLFVIHIIIFMIDEFFMFWNGKYNKCTEIVNVEMDGRKFVCEQLVDCSICLECMCGKNCVEFTCKHIFCEICAHRWHYKMKSCALCRMSTSKIKYT